VRFRGPDSTKVILMDHDFKPSKTKTSNHALFFNRLSIVDLNERSDQPFLDERYILLFNGEIYNYKDLKKQLQEKGITFRTSGDTEVLFEVLKFWGPNAIKLLNGMFAFVFIDLLTKDIIIARDRLGIKPVYYSISGNAISFASECDSIIRLQRSKIEVDHSVLQAYLWLQYTPTPRTIHQSINKLQPGTYLRFNAGKFNKEYSIESYWNAYDQLERNSVSSPAGLNELLTDSLGLQIHADVPVGVFLSSGVDSSLLAAVINHSYTRNDKAFDFFTVAFDETTTSDESEEANRFINGFNNPLLKHRILNVSSASILRKAQNMYEVYDEPFADPAALLNWAISEKAREYVTVVLSGDGADELFWGYDRYNLWRALSHKNSNHVLLTEIKHQLQRLYKGRFNTVFTNDPIQLYYNLLKTKTISSTNPLFVNEFWINTELDRIRNRQDIPSLIDIKSYLPDAMLYKVDRSSMAASIEVRVPYLDNRIVDYALKIPMKCKSNHKFCFKAVLKELLVSMAPHYPIEHPKKGFSMPLHQWLFNEWKTNVYDTLTGISWKEYGIAKKTIDRILKSFYVYNADLSREVWHLYNFGQWLETKKKIL